MRFRGEAEFLKKRRGGLAAAAAPGTDAQMHRELFDRADAGAGALLDLAIRDCVANADVQDRLPPDEND